MTCWAGSTQLWRTEATNPASSAAPAEGMQNGFGDRPGERENPLAAELSGALRAGSVGGSPWQGCQVDTALLRREALHVRHLRHSLLLRRRDRQTRMEEGVLQRLQGHVAAIRNVHVAGDRRRAARSAGRHQ